MKVPRVVKAMEYIDDDLINGAATYAPKKKKPVWLKWGAMAACLCLVIVGAITLFPGQQTSPPVYGVLAEVTEVLGDNQFEAVITGEDENFSKNDTVTVTYENAEEITIAIGDTIAITYSEFEKTEMSFEISAGQIEIVSAD